MAMSGRLFQHSPRPPAAPPRLFIGGIMQGSMQDMGIQAQDYREQIAAIVGLRYPDVEIVDPYKLHPTSVEYDRRQAAETFLAMLDQAAAADVLVAYLPAASMGTALEIWRAYEAGKPVVVISPMSSNWMLWATATKVLHDIDAFSAFVERGALDAYLAR